MGTTAVVLAIFILCTHALAFSREHLADLREETREAFYHGWNHYLHFGFPDDEIAPVSCHGRGSDRANPDNIGVNDVLGDYSLTLVDSLDMLAMMGDQDGFEAAVRKVERFVQFDLPSRVQVFESTIRMLGGLLSGHIYATSPELGCQIAGYDGSLLRLAVDLGDRLMPAFDTPTGIPLARVNLRYGNPNDNITETCSAGAASLVLEFATLSRLSGDDKYEHAARQAFFAVWERRTSLNVVGSAIDAVSGLWLSAYSGIGASVDSFFEYALKSYVLLGDDEYLEVFAKAYSAVKENILDGWIYRNIHILTGAPVTSWIDALAAFFPGLQVLAGDITAAVRSHLVYYKLWMTYAAIPERWNYAVNKGSVELGWYGLRPEFVESNYFLYRATKDPFYLHVGAQILSDIQSRTRTRCGYATIHDVRTGELEDRMESFFLSETLKYLFLLFDVDNPLNDEDSNFVFSTEAHPLRIDVNLLSPAKQRAHKAISNSPVIPRKKSDKRMFADRDLIVEYSPFYTDQGFDEPDDYEDDDDSLDRVPDVIATATCQNVNRYRSFYSFITSWPEFYHLDGLYNFTPISDDVFFSSQEYAERPALPSQSARYCSNIRAFENGTVPVRRPIVDLPPSHPLSVSSPLRSVPILELFFPAETRSRIAHRGRDLEASSFDGHRVRFSKLDGPESRSGGVKIMTVGGIPVMGNVKVQHLMSKGLHEQDILEVLRDGRVRLHGEDVVNLLVGI